VHAVIARRASGRGLVVGGKLDVVHVRQLPVTGSV
jgi:hypothetical protein